nr:DUF4190 domain-containing protein [Cohnella mopanensis]
MKETQYPYPPQQPYSPPPKTNGKAIAALILGIFSIIIPNFGILIGIAAIVFASFSFKDIKRRQELGRGLAKAGLVCGIVGTSIHSLINIIAFIIAFNSSFWEAFNNR